MNNLKSQSGYLIIIFINLRFAYKYGQRIFNHTAYLLPFLFIFYIVLYLIINKIKLTFRTYFISNYNSVRLSFSLIANNAIISRYYCINTKI